VWESRAGGGCGPRRGRWRGLPGLRSEARETAREKAFVPLRIGGRQPPLTATAMTPTARRGEHRRYRAGRRWGHRRYSGGAKSSQQGTKKACERILRGVLPARAARERNQNGNSRPVSPCGELSMPPAIILPKRPRQVNSTKVRRRGFCSGKFTSPLGGIKRPPHHTDPLTYEGAASRTCGGGEGFRKRFWGNWRGRGGGAGWSTIPASGGYFSRGGGTASPPNPWPLGRQPRR
jgi:hypothetical protein